MASATYRERNRLRDRVLQLQRLLARCNDELAKDGYRGGLLARSRIQNARARFAQELLVKAAKLHDVNRRLSHGFD